MAVYSLLKGRIGNILFEIGAGSSLAYRLGVDFFAVCYYSDNSYVQDYQDNILRNIKFADSIPEQYFKYAELDSSYNEISVPEGQDIVLDGFFQSEKYFDIPFVQNLFALDTNYESQIRDKYAKILALHPISINVRRGDYLVHPKQHPVCSMAYFKQAIEIMGKDNEYLITSDDINWCKKNFKGSNFFFADNISAVEGLLVQSLCSGNVISNSSYSWWGAWLKNNSSRPVIYPSPWYGSKYSNLNTKDLLPKDWTLLKRKIVFAVFLHKSYLEILLKNIIKKMFFF